MKRLLRYLAVPGRGLGPAVVLAVLGCGEQDRYQCPAGLVKQGRGCVPVTYQPPLLAYNGVGFLPDRIKRATVLAPAESFALVDAEGTEVYGGWLEGPEVDETGREVWVADFSGFREPGTYRLRVPGVAESDPFPIGEQAYQPLLELLMLGMYGQRCGMEVTIQHQGATFHHGACHTADAVMDAANFGSEGRRSVPGGWHDAGDYGRYVVNGAFSAGMMLLGWEHFSARLEPLGLPIAEAEGRLPDYLDEIRYELDWMLRMQFEDGGVSPIVQTSAWPGMIVPELDREPQHLASAASNATAALVGVMAQAARVFAPYDQELADQYLAAAELGYDYLVANPAPVAGSYENLVHPAYANADDSDYRMWAAVELWETTGLEAALADFESRARTRTTEPNWDWPRVGNLAIYTYLLSRREQRQPSLVERLRQNVLGVADRLVEKAAGDPYGNDLPGVYYWGINGVTARTGINLGVAFLLDRNPKYLDGIVAQVDHLLGRNFYGRSQVTGIGVQPPRDPHHRPSAGDSVLPPWPGLLVGGPNGSISSWQDLKDDYTSNEVAINWNAALIYAVIAAAEPAPPFEGSYQAEAEAGAGSEGGIVLPGPEAGTAGGGPGAEPSAGAGGHEPGASAGSSGMAGSACQGGASGAAGGC